MSQYNVIRILSILTALIIAYAIAIVARQAKRPASRYFLGFLACIFLVLVSGICELGSRADSAILLFSHIGYSAIAFMPVFWIAFAIHYGTDRRFPARALFITLSLVPLATALLAFAGSKTGMLWSKSSIRDLSGQRINVVEGYGPWFWVHFLYSYLLFLIGAFFIFKELLGSIELYRRQALLVLAATTLPIVGNLLYVFRILPGLTKDLSPVALGLSGILFSVSVSKYRLLEMNPPSRDTMVDYFEEGLLIVEGDGKIIYCNVAAARMLGKRKADEMIGLSLAPAFARGSSRPQETIAEAIASTVRQAGGPELKLSVKPIESGRGDPARYAISLRPSPVVEPWSVNGRGDSEGSAVLSDRELEVADLLVAGVSQKGIATRLFISENTVKTHIRHIYRKTGVNKRRELENYLSNRAE